jgi:hypothetical protein
MLSSRTYVVKSPALASQVQRSSSTLDFDQLVVEMTPRMVGLSADCKRILQDKTAKEEGRVRMVTQSHDVINPQLFPQKMDAIAAVQLEHFTDFVNAIPQGFETELYTFVTRELTAASMHTFYGPENPFAMHPELIEDFWRWESGIVAYMIGVFPSITARTAYNGLENCVKGFIEYLEKGRDKQAYKLIQGRKALHDAVGITILDQARLEMGLSFAFNSNASITIFWVLNNIFSRPDLLAEIREEIKENALVGTNTISFTKLRQDCPLLNSVYRETMRLVAPMTSARFVLEDTIIADTYLLRKDTVVQIAGGVLHADTDIWGPDAASFNARRFLYSLNGSKSNPDGSIPDGKSNQVHPAAFRGFGGGISYCPGRHFAQMEIISLTAVLVYGFDLLPQKGKGELKYDPPKDDKRFPFAVTKPLADLDVKLVRREGMEDVVWKVEV